MNVTTSPAALPLNVSYNLPTGSVEASSAFLILGAAAVFIMTPGLGLFYGGMAGRKSNLTLMMTSFLCMAVITVQWFIWGFSLAYSQYGTTFIGSYDYMGFSGVNIYSVFLTDPSVSAIVFALYQLQFAMVTPAIIFGSVTERIRLLPIAIFIFCWSTLVYDVVAYWTWAARGWLRNLSCERKVFILSCAKQQKFQVWIWPAISLQCLVKSEESTLPGAAPYTLRRASRGSPCASLSAR